jgi:hypothetical protein
VLKGGYAMELRIHSARTTKDIDLTLHDGTRLSKDPMERREQVRTMLQEEAATRLNDYFEFLVGEAREDAGEKAILRHLPVRPLVTGKAVNCKDGKLKGKNFFDAEQDPLITFHSKKIEQTGPNTFDIDGDFTIRGVTKPEKLTLTVTGKGTGAGEINGTMAFDRKDYGMNKGIPFVTIADRVEVTVALKVKRVSGPPLVFKQ